MNIIEGYMMKFIINYLFCLFSLFILSYSSPLDGPYLFYRNGKAIIKNVTASGQEKEEVMDSAACTSVQCIYNTSGQNFSVELHKEHIIPPDTYPLPSKIVAVSDIEGNFPALIAFLKGVGIMNDSFEWIFGDGHFLYLGDLFDRGNQVTECLWLIYSLQQQAESEGGKVHFLIGNHEYLNLTEDFRYVDSKYIDNAKILGESGYESMYTKQTELGRWLRVQNGIVMLGNYLFCHAGYSPKLAKENLSNIQINTILRKAIDKSQLDQLDELVVKTHGILWYRGFFKDHGSGKYKKATSTEINTILNTTNASRIFVGHTVISDHITMHFNDRILCLDMPHESTFKNGIVRGFLYESGAGYEIDNKGKRTKLFEDATHIFLKSQTHKTHTIATVYSRNSNSIFFTGLDNNQAYYSIHLITGKTIINGKYNGKAIRLPDRYVNNIFVWRLKLMNTQYGGKFLVQ